MIKKYIFNIINNVSKLYLRKGREGMRCPYCTHEESKVIDSRSTDDDMAIRRRRECLKCGKRYTTYEKIEDIPILIIKKDSTRENFDKNKIVNGLIKACQKRPVLAIK